MRMPRKVPINALFEPDQLRRIDEAAARERKSRAQWLREAAEAKLAGQAELEFETTDAKD